MRRRLLAALLLAAALGVHLGVTTPSRRARDEARELFAQARAERERLRAQAARLERSAAPARAPSGDAEAVRALRESLLRATDGLPLRAVRIGAEAGRRGAVAAKGHLSAEGRQADLLRVAGRLAAPASAALVQRVRLARRPAGDLGLEVEALSLRSVP